MERIFGTQELVEHKYSIISLGSLGPGKNPQEKLLEMLKTAKPWDEISEEPLVPLGLGEPPSKMLRNTSPAQSSATQTMSFKLELKQCEVGCVLQDKLVDCLSNLG